MLTLALVFQRLAVRRPDLDAGVCSYARAGFGESIGFIATAGYRASSFLGNVTDWGQITVFLFIGVEGASVLSRYARTRRDVGRETVLGFLSVLAIFASVTIASSGVLSTADTAALPQPSMAGVLQAAVGSWGGVARAQNG